MKQKIALFCDVNEEAVITARDVDSIYEVPLVLQAEGLDTVVLKLLNIVRPDRAYFGEKDYQQLQAIREMVGEFSIPTEIVACSTVREASGLAESSRNALLSDGARRKASAIHRVLESAIDPVETSQIPVSVR